MSEKPVTLEDHIKHEVEIRVLQFKNDDLYNKIDQLDAKLDSRFILTLTTIVGVGLIPVFLHAAKLM